MHPLNDAVPTVLAELLARQPLSPAKVAFAWRVAVGPALARATEVTLGPDGILRVTTADQHWLREVEQARRLILARLSRLLGPDVVRRLVADVVARAGGDDVGRAPRAAPRRRRPRPPSR